MEVVDVGSDFDRKFIFLVEVTDEPIDAGLRQRVSFKTGSIVFTQEADDEVSCV